jgi:hypothetical protein
MDRSTNHANVILNSERFQKLFLQNRHGYIIHSDTVCGQNYKFNFKLYVTTFFADSIG